MNIVAIVGRPNVGKSTLFNRIIQERNAIVEAEPGVTRDRIYAQAEWNGKHFMLVDTGGIVTNSEEIFDKAIREQAMLAITEADAIIFVCDAKDGITPMDKEVANLLRTSKKPITLVVNKADNAAMDNAAYEFYNLGLGEPYAISAMSGRSTGDFLDVVVEPLSASEEDKDTRLKIAIVGRPNAGKSSILNTILGKERAIVTPIAGTTRDAIDTVFKYHGEEIVLIDTAGLRRRSHVTENIEMYSIIRTTRAIERCDVAVVVLDAERGLEDQDKKIINQCAEARKGILIAVNKWDLVEKDSNTAVKFEKDFLEELVTLNYLPLVFVSALTKQRVPKIVEMAKEIQAKRATRISTSKLNDALLEDISRTPPPAVSGHDLRINYITQVSIEPPVFAFFANRPELLPDSYKRFMENKLREHYDFKGVPISFVFRRKNTKYEER
ncbi:MAG: ribosome biogenesis GTPase Der [Bacteroidota bacterium]